MLTSSKIFLKKSNPQTYAKGTRHRGCPRAMPRTAPGGCGFRGSATGLRRILQLPQGDVALRHAGALEHQKLAQSGEQFTIINKSSKFIKRRWNIVETKLIRIWDDLSNQREESLRWNPATSTHRPTVEWHFRFHWFRHGMTSLLLSSIKFHSGRTWTYSLTVYSYSCLQISNNLLLGTNSFCYNFTYSRDVHQDEGATNILQSSRPSSCQIISSFFLLFLTCRFGGSIFDGTGACNPARLELSENM